MHILNGLKRQVLRVRSHFCGTALVLAYHRVAKLPTDPQFLCVSPSHFREQLEVLRAGFRILSLKQLADALEHSRLPSRSIAVTFDDGYFDNLLEAKPLLQRFEVPATFFITTGYLGTQREFWWDELERVLLVPTQAPAALEIDLSSSKHRWDASTRDQRSLAYRELIELLRPLHPSIRERALQSLRRQCGISEQGRPTHRALTPVEVTQLITDGLLDAGAHTVSHAQLAFLPEDTQREEILTSRRTLEELTGRKVEYFAYPYGTFSDVGDVTRDIVRGAGFKLGCSTNRTCTTKGTNRWWLPRFGVRDCDGAEFARRLDAYFGM